MSSGDHNGHPNVNACIINIVVVLLVVCSVIRVLNNEKYYSSKICTIYHHEDEARVVPHLQPFLKGSDKQIGTKNNIRFKCHLI